MGLEWIKLISKQKAVILNQPIIMQKIGIVLYLIKNTLPNYFVENLTNSSCWVVWDKDNGDSIHADCELAWTSFKTSVRKIKWLWHGMRQQNMKNKETRIHPTQKPIQLYRWILQNYAKAGDTILDTHGGSMSSAIACHMEGFELDICELDKEYFDAAVNRFKIYEQQLTLF